MMSAPDRVDVDLPNTQDARMPSVKSNENLRLAAQNSTLSHQVQVAAATNAGTAGGSFPAVDPAHANASIHHNHHHHQQQQQQHHRPPPHPVPVDGSSGAAPAPVAAASSYPPRRNSLSQSMPPRMMPPAPAQGAMPYAQPHPSNSSIPAMQAQQAAAALAAQQQQQQIHSQRNQTETATSDADYTAWTIGSTETLRTSGPANTVASEVTSPWKSPKRSSKSLSPSPDPTDTTVNSTGGSTVPSVSSVTPPLREPTPPTLGGISHSMSANVMGRVGLPPTPPLEMQGIQHQLQQQQQTSHATQQQSQQQFNLALQEVYHTRLLSNPTPAVESLLSSSCECLNFDIAEMWLRTGPKTHQLTNSHVRPTALDESVRIQLVDVYYGERSAERTHRLSPALCKRAKEAGDVVWVTAHTPHGAEALKCSISDVRTAVAVPVCHGGSGVNVTIIYFSIRRAIMKPQALEFLVHMSLATAAAAVNSLPEEVMVDEMPQLTFDASLEGHPPPQMSRSAHVGDHHLPLPHPGSSISISRDGPHRIVSVTGAKLNLQWDSLRNVEYLTDGGNNWIHTAVLHGRSVVVKTLKPECQDVALAINEIEGELEIHSRLDHPNVVQMIGAGYTPRGVRFVVLERLDGGTMTQLLGYDTRIRDRRKRFWNKKKISYMEVLKCARSLADAMAYCHGRAIPNAMVLHRDLKPDNVGFTLDGTVKLIDFGLARIVENATVSNDVYEMSGETGSLRYMAPEVAGCQPYNQKADVYSFGVILWELVAFKKPYDGMNREEFYSRVVHGGERPPINKKWPEDLSELMKSCWDAEVVHRPNFSDIVDILDSMLVGEKDGETKKKRPKNKNKFVSALIDRHSTWF